MKTELYYFLEDYLKEQGYKCNQAQIDPTIIEILRESDEVYIKHIRSYRWWEEWLHVVKIKDKYIGYIWAEANRDESVMDLGWEFDFSQVFEYEPREFTETIFVKKEN